MDEKKDARRLKHLASYYGNKRILLEEEVTVVNNACLDVEFLNEATGGLQGLVLQLVFHLLGIKLSAFAGSLLGNLYHIGTTITLDDTGIELTLL